MAEITRERQGQMVRTAFQVLIDHGEPLPARQVIAEVEKRLPLTEFEASDYPNRPGVRRFEKIIRFNTIPATKAGWLLKNKGSWILTDAGQKALIEFPDPADFIRESIRLYRAWKHAQPVVDDGVIQEETPEKAVTREEAEELAWIEIQEYLQHMNPYDFQQLVASLLGAMGYHVAWISPPGPDQGLDILAYTDPLGAAGPRIKVQVKRQATTRVSVDTVRSFLAILATQDVGIFIASGGFTSEAEREVRGQEQRRISLIDLERLYDLWVDHYDQVPEDEQKLLPLTPIYFLAPPE